MPPPIHVLVEPDNVILLGNRVFADVMCQEEVIMGKGGPNLKD